MSFDPRWEELHAQREWGRYPSEHLVRFVKRTFADRRGVALDLGCGAGAQTRMLVKEGFHVDAVDASMSALVKLRDVIDEPLSIYQSDLADFRGFDACYDLIVDVCALQHLSLDDMVIVVSRTHDWLNPGGWFFSLMASDDNGPAAVGCIEPRIISFPQLTALFTGYHCKIGHVLEHPPSGGIVAHWIVEAQKPLTA